MNNHFYQRAIVLGASGGIGHALLGALPADHVIALSRSGGDFDLTDERSIEAAARRVASADLILDATGALELVGAVPEKSFDALDPWAMARQYQINAIGPALILKHFMPILDRDRRSVIASLSARVGSIGDNRLGGWVSYRAAKAGLNQIIHTAAIELARRNKQAICVALHPGTVRTPLTAKYVGRHPAVGPQEAAANIVSVLDSLSVQETGGFFDWQGDRIPG